MKKTTFKHSLLHLILLLATITLIPYVITQYFYKSSPTDTTIIPYDGRLVILEDPPLSTTLDYSDYLTGMVARILVSMDESVYESPEFLRLITLLCNTLLTSEFEETKTLQADFLSDYYIDENSLKTLWGNDYPNRMELLQSIILANKNQVLTHNENLIKPFYHYTSNGMTRAFESSSSANSQAQIYPYVKSVNTSKDLETPGFLCVNQINNQDFIKAIENAYPNIKLQNSPIKEQIQITHRDPYGYVLQLQISNQPISADDFMQLFDLKSTAFTFAFQEDSLKIITKGIGHGYGISLSYALNMALSGNTVEDILSFFYENVEITNVEIKTIE